MVSCVLPVFSSNLCCFFHVIKGNEKKVFLNEHPKPNLDNAKSSGRGRINEAVQSGDFIAVPFAIWVIKLLLLLLPRDL